MAFSTDEIVEFVTVPHTKLDMPKVVVASPETFAKVGEICRNTPYANEPAYIFAARIGAVAL